MPEDSDRDFRRESPDRSLGGRKVRVWAICHVGREPPAVKIFDAWNEMVRDITFGHLKTITLKTIVCIPASECK